MKSSRKSLQTELILPDLYDLERTLWLAGMGQRDPTLCVRPNEADLAFVTPDGPVCIHAERRGTILVVESIGAGKRWIEPRLSGLFGLNDRPEEFQPTGKMECLVQKRPGLHLPTLPVVFHRLVQVVLQQLVSWTDALHGWCQIVQRYGSDSSFPGVRIPPEATALAGLGYYDLVQCGVMPKQARLILYLARNAKRIERMAAKGHTALEPYLLSIRGIGDWTVQHLLGCSCGYADAVLTGDYGLPHTVAWFLVGKERSDDDEMLRLLEPFKGHRFRVVNYLWQNGINAPRRGPRMRTNRWRFEPVGRKSKFD